MEHPHYPHRLSNGPGDPDPEAPMYRRMQPLPTRPDDYVELETGGHIELYRAADVVRLVASNGVPAFDMTVARASEIAAALAKLTEETA